MTKRKIKIVYRNKPTPKVEDKYSDSALKKEVEELESRRQYNKSQQSGGFFNKLGTIVRDAKLNNEIRMRQNIMSSRRKLETLKTKAEAAKLQGEIMKQRREMQLNMPKPIKYEDLM